MNSTNLINYYNINDYNKLKIKFNLTIIFNKYSFNTNIDQFIICIDTLIVKLDIFRVTETWLTDIYIIYYIYCKIQSYSTSNHHIYSQYY